LLKNRIQNPRNLFVKNVIDKTVAVVVFLLCIPVMGVIALSLFLENPKAPILFRQQRVAKGGGRFWLLKFRTMYPDSDAILQEYLQSHPDKRREWRKYRKLKGYDPRVTRVGKILRRYSLDELPQLFNVLKGDMSLVGPRPYLAEEVERMGDAAHTIFLLKPGMTGLWQVSGRNSLTFSERIDIDIWYLYNWSLWNDFVILLKTIRALYEKSGY
jgi:undecaprenyl-phosphate galactose phosphotransferase